MLKNKELLYGQIGGWLGKTLFGSVSTTGSAQKIILALYLSDSPS